MNICDELPSLRHGTLHRTATTLPVPSCPGLGPYPGSVATITISFTLPLIVEPDLVMLLDTTTAWYCETVAGGPELLPGAVDHVPPHVGAAFVFSKPLKLAGAEPPLRLLCLLHCEPQKLTWAPVP